MGQPRGSCAGTILALTWLFLAALPLVTDAENGFNGGGGVVGGGSSDLVINVGVASTPEEAEEAEREGGGGVSPMYRQVVSGNSSTDTVTLEYQEPDGTLVTQLTDFRTQAQVTRIILLGEEEQGEPVHQVLCFVSAFTGDLIPPEAVMKLRQKHPGTVRIAESDEGEVVQDSAYNVRMTTSMGAGGRAMSSGGGGIYQISSHLAGLCRDAKATTFTSSHELHAILQEAAKKMAMGSNKLVSEDNNNSELDSSSQLKLAFQSLVEKFPRYETLPRCASLISQGDDDVTAYYVNDVITTATACQCTKQVMFNWYPCALKYCRNQDGEGEHRCGIRTCKKIQTFRYPVKSRLHCSWDEM